jgi:hypothetical protein
VIPPERLALLRRWREALIGAACLLVGLWLVSMTLGLPWLLGGALCVVGAVLIAGGVRRARFGTGAEAPGVVEAIEGRIAYFGPVSGGVVALDDLTVVSFHAGPRGAFWRLAVPGQAPLDVPQGARGAEDLLDALAPLPGMDGAAMVRASRLGDGAAPGAPGETVVWRRPGQGGPTPLPRR